MRRRVHSKVGPCPTTHRRVDMTEFASPSLVEVPTTSSISTLLTDRVERSGDDAVIERRLTPGGPWQPVSARAFDDDVVEVARGLVARGVQAGDRVAIMSRTRYEWTLLDFAVWAAGGVPIPVYETSSADQVEWILSDSGVSVALV